MIREIRLLGDPVLRTVADPVEDVDDDVRSLVGDLMDTMYEADGVGLAAPQVGIALRVIVVDTREEGGEGPLALVNPRIVESSSGTEKAEEGCLSIPGIADIVERSCAVVVEALDPDGQPLRVEAEGLRARALQHEVDHLDGVLFLDRLSALKRRMALQKWRKLQEGDDA
ncbi:MAG TPA: peptide deformylase [Longimicrobiales bacterium]|nr:peptide deformylase [Longimicrobiales bacterium]